MCSQSDGSCKCSPGFYGQRCENKCMDSCTECTSSTQCTACPIGKYGFLCSTVCNCRGCPCDISTGECKELSACESKCTNFLETGVCTACQVGFYGSQCSYECPNGCSGMCDFNKGTCDACKVDYYGHKCDKNCYLRCSGCHQNGTCLQCTQPDMYGTYCDQQCSSLCINKTCDRWTGKCALRCDIQCETCDHHTRKCTKCKQNSNYGDNCQY